MIKLSPNWKKGFTLIELVVVISLLAVICGASIATVHNVQRRNLYSAALMIQADMRQAQRLAIMEGRRYVVRFDRLNHSYFVHPVGEPDDTPNKLPRGVRIHNMTLRVAQIEYLPRGTLGGEGANGFTIFLRNGIYALDMTVIPVTGRVDIKKDDIMRLRFR